MQPIKLLLFGCFYNQVMSVEINMITQTSPILIMASNKTVMHSKHHLVYLAKIFGLEKGSYATMLLEKSG